MNGEFYLYVSGMKEKKVKVLYIAGFERSGSTIINRVLGQINGFVAWGELRDIWQHGFLENRICACGSSFKDCEEWNRVFNKSAVDDKRAEELVQLLQRTKALTLLESLGPLAKRIIKANCQDYLRELEHFYMELKLNTNSQVVVDSTKASWYGYALSLISNIDLYVVHVVRDPRGVCYSLQQRKAKGEPECQWYSPIHAAASWTIKNLAVEKFLGSQSDRYLRIKYEDFMTNPEKCIRLMTNLLGENTVELPFLTKDRVQMQLDHLFSGSPSSRAMTGEVQLKVDSRWQSKISRRDKNLITSLTFPMLAKYDYLHQASRSKPAELVS